MNDKRNAARAFTLVELLVVIAIIAILFLLVLRMFIVWGKKRVERKQGMVADFCPICREVRAFTLIRLHCKESPPELPDGWAVA